MTVMTTIRSADMRRPIARIGSRFRHNGACRLRNRWGSSLRPADRADDRPSRTRDGSPCWFPGTVPAAPIWTGWRLADQLGQDGGGGCALAPPSTCASMRRVRTRPAVAQANKAADEGAKIILGARFFADIAMPSAKCDGAQGINVLSFPNNTDIAGGNVFVLGNTFDNVADRLVKLASGTASAAS